MDGNGLIAAERDRQVQAEGYTAEHDDDHEDGELLQAARCYEELGNGSFGPDGPDADQSEAEMPDGWPWDEDWWKPKTRLKNLVRAGALYQAEAERLSRKIESLAQTIDALLKPKEQRN